VVLGDISVDADVVDLRSGAWLKHPLQSGTRGVFDYGLELEAVLNSWKDAFSYVRENAATNTKGLRGP
jgi:hypothetical protein